MSGLVPRVSQAPDVDVPGLPVLTCDSNGGSDAGVREET